MTMMNDDDDDDDDDDDAADNDADSEHHDGLPCVWDNRGNLLTIFLTCQGGDGLCLQRIGSQKTLDELDGLLTRGIR